MGAADSREATGLEVGGTRERQQLGGENGDSEEVRQAPVEGYHVLQVQEHSPGHQCGLVSFFDFIVAANNVPMRKDKAPFVEILKENIGKPVVLQVYNTKSDTLREIVLVPSDSWGGAGLAGISIRFCSVEPVLEHVWHVLDVAPKSPASLAGLQPRTDYIVGTPDLMFTDSEDFFTLINANEGKGVPLYVYSTNTDQIRLISIVPNSRWGGAGSIGCDIGYGYLHRIPLNRNIPAALPSEQHTNNTTTFQPSTSESFSQPNTKTSEGTITTHSSVQGETETETAAVVAPESKRSDSSNTSPPELLPSTLAHNQVFENLEQQALPPVPQQLISINPEELQSQSIPQDMEEVKLQ